MQNSSGAALEKENVRRGDSLLRLKALEQRVRNLHPVLKNIRITHRWGAPHSSHRQISPPFSATIPKSKKPHSPRGYSGHGVALSVYLGEWAAQALLGKRLLPTWIHHR